VCYLGRVYLLLVMHRGKLAELQHLQMWGVGLEPPRHPPLDLQRIPQSKHFYFLLQQCLLCL
jgi:hypothetical protein